MDADLRALEKFAVGNEDPGRLESLLRQFDIFEAIGAIRQELRHPDLLAFLLDPGKSHGPGDAFAKRLLHRVLATGGAGDPVTPARAPLRQRSEGTKSTGLAFRALLSGSGAERLELARV